MGLSSIVKSATGIGSSLVKGFGDFGGNVGTLLNQATGTTSASKQQQAYAKEMAAINQKYALESAKVNNKYQKEFAQNAHQWEIEDLKKAGLNPVLSAGGDGTGASGGGVASGSASGASVMSAGLNPIEMAIGAWNGYEQAKNTGADTGRKNAEIANINQDTTLKYWETLTEIEKAPLTKAQREQVEAEKNKILKLTPVMQKNLEAETKYTNERARGFSETTSGEGKFLGFGGGGSHSKSW